MQSRSLWLRTVNRHRYIFKKNLFSLAKEWGKMSPKNRNPFLAKPTLIQLNTKKIFATLTPNRVPMKNWYSSPSPQVLREVSGIVTLRFPYGMVSPRLNKELIFHSFMPESGNVLHFPTSQELSLHPNSAWTGARWCQAEYTTLCSSLLWKALLTKWTNRPQPGRNYLCTERSLPVFRICKEFIKNMYD